MISLTTPFIEKYVQHIWVDDVPFLFKLDAKKGSYSFQRVCECCGQPRPEGVSE